MRAEHVAAALLAGAMALGGFQSAVAQDLAIAGAGVIGTDLEAPFVAVEATGHEALGGVAGYVEVGFASPAYTITCARTLPGPQPGVRIAYVAHNSGAALGGVAVRIIDNGAGGLDEVGYRFLSPEAPPDPVHCNAGSVTTHPLVAGDFQVFTAP